MRSPALALAALALAGALPARVITYSPDPSDFPSPERGFSVTFVKQLPAAAELARLRESGHLSLVRRVFGLDAWRGAPLPPEALADFEKDFAAIRAAGLKAIPRFAYNFDASGPDAPLPRVLEHIAQLAPLLRRNADVIAFVQAGFIGRWGEWHDSSNGLDSPRARAAILKALLEALPPQRSVVLRYPEHKKEFLLSRGNLAEAQAHGPEPAARLGFHNDCFLAPADDRGTFFREAPDTIEGQKAWLARETKYVVMSGETCELCARAGDCRQALRELERFHFSELNEQYEPKVLARWREGGCMDEVARRLGYRLELLRAELPEQAARGAILDGSFTVANRGFAAPYNPRPVELVLRDPRGRELRLPLADADPRRWEPGQEVQVPIRAALPAGLAPGPYYVFLNFPDPAPALSRRPAYSLRLANAGLWEAKTGCHWLRARLIVR